MLSAASTTHLRAAWSIRSQSCQFPQKFLVLESDLHELIVELHELLMQLGLLSHILLSWIHNSDSRRRSRFKFLYLLELKRYLSL
jgi:hypothetical protein